jgi:hypothetical protein
VHEHQWAARVRSEYLNELEVERKGLSTMRRRAGISSEGRLGVKAIPVKEGQKLDQIRSGS